MNEHSNFELVVEQAARQDPVFSTNPTLAFFGVGYGARLELEYEKAELALRKCTTLDPTYTLGFQILGVLYAEVKQNAKAIECFRRVLELECKGIDPEIEEENPFFYMGMCYEAIGGLEDAKIAYSKSIESSPRHYESFLRLGRIYHEQNDYLQAIQVYENALVTCRRYEPKFLDRILLRGIRLNLDRARNKQSYKEYQPSEEEKLLDCQLMLEQTKKNEE